MTVVYVVTVEQSYANTFSVKGAFLKAEDAEACCLRYDYLGPSDVHVYACEGEDCHDLATPMPKLPGRPFHWQHAADCPAAAYDGIPEGAAVVYDPNVRCTCRPANRT